MHFLASEQSGPFRWQVSNSALAVHLFPPLPVIVPAGEPSRHPLTRLFFDGGNFAPRLTANYRLENTPGGARVPDHTTELGSIIVDPWTMRKNVLKWFLDWVIDLLTWQSILGDNLPKLGPKSAEILPKCIHDREALVLTKKGDLRWWPFQAPLVFAEHVIFANF